MPSTDDAITTPGGVAGAEDGHQQGGSADSLLLSQGGHRIRTQAAEAVGHAAATIQAGKRRRTHNGAQAGCNVNSGPGDLACPRYGVGQQQGLASRAADCAIAHAGSQTEKAVSGDALRTSRRGKSRPSSVLGTTARCTDP